MLEDSVLLALQEHLALRELLLAPIVPRIRFLLLAPVRVQPAQTDKVPHP